MEPILNRHGPDKGLSPRRLRHSELAHPVAGVSMLAADAEVLAPRCRAVALVLPPDAVFTHLTGARLRGWWLPRLDDEPLIACSNADAAHVDRRGVYVRRCALPEEHRQVVRGVPVASPEWTIVELAEHLALIDLVVAIDCALRRRETSVEAIRATMRRGRRGVRVLRRALDLVDGRSDSPYETVLRLVHVLSGIPVVTQYQLRTSDGEIVYSLDLLIRGTRRAAEFDGGVHRTAEVHARDMRRDRLLARDGIERYAYGADDVHHASEQIVRDADAALGRPHDPRKMRPWLEELERSTYSARGYGALRHRIRRFVRASTPRPSGARRQTNGAESSLSA